MPLISANGIRINYEDHGAGEPVVMLMGSGASGRVWEEHQVPALTAAGYRVITIDNRGIAPTDLCAAGFTVADMAADTAALIEALELGPCRLAGTSMGAYILLELALARPELVTQAVLMAVRGRTDAVRRTLNDGEMALYDSGVQVPAPYLAAVQALLNLSPRTLRRDMEAQDWLDILELSSSENAGTRAQMAIDPPPGRLPAYRNVDVPCRVISFADDLITPPHLGREVAEVLPNADFHLVADCGHYGYLEDPTTVNKLLIEFFRQPVTT